MTQDPSRFDEAGEAPLEKFEALLPALVVVRCVECGLEVWGEPGEAGRIWETPRPRPEDVEPDEGYCSPCLRRIVLERRP